MCPNTCVFLVHRAQDEVPRQFGLAWTVTFNGSPCHVASFPFWLSCFTTAGMPGKGKRDEALGRGDEHAFATDYDVPVDTPKDEDNPVE